MIGTDVSSALWKSLPISVLAAWSVLASPASATIRRGWAACTRATAARSARTVASALACSRHLERDQRGAAAGRDQGRPPGLSGDRMSGPPGAVAAAPRPRRRPRRATAGAGRGVPGELLRAWIEDGFLGRADHVELVQHLLRLAGLPGSYCCWLCVPSNCPAASAVPASTSQPTITAIRCRALQRAIRSTIGARGRGGRRGGERLQGLPARVAGGAAGRPESVRWRAGSRWRRTLPGAALPGTAGGATSGRGAGHIGQGRVEGLAHQASWNRGRLSRAAVN